MADFLNKFMEANNLDGLVPILDLEDLYQEDGPLLKDHFLGVVDARSGDQPRCVVFVDPNANTNGDFHGNTTNSNGFYDEYQAPSWMEHSVDLNDLDSMNTTTFSSPPDSVSTAPFLEPPSSQNFIPDPYDFSSKIQYPQEAAVAPQQQLKKSPQVKKSHVEQSEMEYSDYYASDESSVASVHSTTSWASTEEEYPSKEAILEEIHREAAEIERLSVSPPAKPSLRKTKSSNTKIAKPQKSTRSRIPKSFVERKKELNRAAATKYREKKRAERDHLGQEREVLETRNTELRAEVSAMSSEIEYLKKLIKDIEARTK